MEDYNKIIESLGVRFIKSKNIKVLQHLTIKNSYDVENTILLLYKGEITFGKDNEKVYEGDILFIPGGKMFSITYGHQNPVMLTNEDFMGNKEKYFGINRDISKVGLLADSFGYITFEAKVFDSVNFFASLDIPPFVIRDAPDLGATITEVVKEELLDLPGKGRILKIKTDEIVVKVVRYILENRLFV